MPLNVPQTRQETPADTLHPLPELRNYIDGEVSVPAQDRGNSLIDPNTRAPLQAQRSCSEEQVERALDAADRFLACIRTGEQVPTFFVDPMPAAS